MTIAMIAAGALLGTVSQPMDPSLAVGVAATQRVYQWMIVPGSGVFPVPTPFVVYVPLGKIEEKLSKVSKARQELHIVIQAEREGVITESFAQAVLDGIKNVIEDVQNAEKAIMTSSKPDCRKSDPQQVIDPVVTGF